MKRIEVACGVVLNEKGQYLIAERGDRAHNGKWEFAGGKLKKNESPYEAIQRELKEELNITVQPKSELLRYPFKDYLLIFIECKYLSGEIELKEHNSVKWVFLSELKNYEFLEGDKNFINKLKNV
jgi:8-oxo-dGTP diphosphatase